MGSRVIAVSIGKDKVGSLLDAFRHLSVRVCVPLPAKSENLSPLSGRVVATLQVLNY